MKKSISFIFFTAINCQPKKMPTSVQKDQGYVLNHQNLNHEKEDQEPSETKKEIETKLEKKKIEKKSAKNLFVSKIRVGSYQDKTTLNEIIMYEVLGVSDYVEYNICPLGRNECISNVYTLDRLILPIILAQQISIKIRACIDKEKSIDEQNCGQWNELIHDTKRYDDDLARILSEKDRIIKRLGSIEEDYRNALKAYQSDAYECLKQDASAQKFLDKKLKFIDMILASPPGLIADSVAMQANRTVGFLGMEDGAQAVSGTISGFFSQFSNFVGEQCENLGESMCQTGHMIKDMGGMMLSAFNPIHSIGILSNAFFDITASDEEMVKKTCHADDSFQLRQKTMDQLWIQSRDQLKKIRSQIESKGSQ